MCDVRCSNWLVRHSTFDIRNGYRRDGRGSVLLYVLWVVLLLSLFAAGVGSRALSALNLSERLSEQLRATYIARGAVPYAAMAIVLDATPVDGLNESWANQSGLEHYPLAGGSFSLLAPEEEARRQNAPVRHGFSDEERRINLNTAPTEVLQRLLDTVGGLQPDDAEAVAAAIEDWRDPDDDERPFGAEGFYYHSLSHPYDCKDGPFENVEELLLVKGIVPELYHRLEPYVTVFGSGKVNLNTAGRPILRALGLSDVGVSGMLAFRSGPDGREATSDDFLLTSVDALQSELKSYVPVEDLVRLNVLSQADVLSVASEAFRGTIEAVATDSASRIRVACVLDRGGHVKWWQER